MSKVIIPNPERYQKIVSTLIEGGAQSLQVVSDFDNTITAIGSPHTWSAVESFPEFSQEYLETSKKNFEFYHEKELSSTITLEEKVKYMEEWWSVAHAMVLKEGLRRNSFVRMVEAVRGELKFRDKCVELFELLNKNQIPCLIFSAGIGNVIEVMLKELNYSHPNMHIVSNFMSFESEADDALGVAWNEELIHVFNKHMVNMNNLPYKKDVVGRKNVILIGDSPGDVTMSEGLEVDTLLKIGLLSMKVEERMEEFLSKFDVVLVMDNTMDFLYSLVGQIVAGKSA